MAEGLDAKQQQRALEVGHVDAGPGYPALLEQAGFEHIFAADVTAAYLATLESWIDTWNEEAAALQDLIGATEFAERQARRNRTLQSGKSGLIRRLLLSAERPDPAA